MAFKAFNFRLLQIVLFVSEEQPLFGDGAKPPNMTKSILDYTINMCQSMIETLSRFKVKGEEGEVMGHPDYAEQGKVINDYLTSPLRWLAIS